MPKIKPPTGTKPQTTVTGKPRATAVELPTSIPAAPPRPGQITGKPRTKAIELRRENSPPMRPAQTDWLMDRMRSVGHSLRSLAATMEKGDASNLSYWFRGKYDGPVTRVSELARALQISTHEAMYRLGYEVVHLETPMRGSIGPTSVVIDSGTSTTTLPSPEAKVRAAYQVVAAGSPFDGGLVFVGAPAPTRDCVGRMALAKFGDEERLCTVHPGLSREPGRYRLTPVFGSGEGLADAELATVRPVIWMKL